MRHHFVPWSALLLATTCAAPGADPPRPDGATPVISADPNDWPTYNHDVIGTRHNAGERTLDKDTVAGLEEKWRFPAKDSTEVIGAIHATPVVVNGCVYFGTVTRPTFYKLGPDGRVKWSYPKRGDPAGGTDADRCRGILRVGPGDGRRRLLCQSRRPHLRAGPPNGPGEVEG